MKRVLLLLVCALSMGLLFKPYRVGDYIEAQGQAGTVKEIQLFNTVLNTPDNKTILVPNGSLSTGIINNYSHEERRRVDWTFGIGYGDSYDYAKATLIELKCIVSRRRKQSIIWQIFYRTTQFGG